MNNFTRTFFIIILTSCISLHGMQKDVLKKIEELRTITTETAKIKETTQSLQKLAKSVIEPAIITATTDKEHIQALHDITTFFESLYSNYSLKGSESLNELKKNLSEKGLKDQETAIEEESKAKWEEETKKSKKIEEIRTQYRNLIVENIELIVKTLEHLQKKITGNKEEKTRMGTLLQEIEKIIGTALTKTGTNPRILNKKELLKKDALKDLIPLYNNIVNIIMVEPPPPKTEEQKKKEDIAQQATVTQHEVQNYTTAFNDLLKAAGITKTPDNVTKKDIALIFETLKSAFEHLNTKQTADFARKKESIGKKITQNNATAEKYDAQVTKNTKSLEEIQKQYLQVLAEQLVIQAQFSPEEQFVVKDSLKNYAGVKELPKDITKQAQSIIDSVTASKIYTTASKQVEALKINVPSYFDTARQKYKKQKK